MCTLFLFCNSCPICYFLNLNNIPLVSDIYLVLSGNTSFLCTCYSLSLYLSYISQLFFKIIFFFVTHKFSIFSTCHSVTRNCTSSFIYSVTFFFLSLVLFYLPLSIFISKSPYLPITSTFSSSLSVLLSPLLIL